VTRDVSIVIPAANASATIERALLSARRDGPAAIVLIDRGSTDDTVGVAKRAAGSLLEVVHAPADATLGRVRQIGLEAVRTAFGVWLNAGDELLPGRAARLVAQLELHDADLVFDEIDLHDEGTGSFVRRIEMPPFLGGRRQIVRLFERDYLPGAGVPAFRTAAAKAIGFDQQMNGGEDVDLVLRSIVAGRHIALVRQAGYRQFSSRSTPSDTGDEQRMRAALQKHAPSVVERLFTSAGYHARTIAWGMVSFLTLRGDYALALAWLDTLPQGARREFHRGTLLAALGEHERALAPLQQAYDEAGVPELLNNFGVVLAAVGRTAEANSLFADALREFPGYTDASANLLAERPTRLTLLPLRREPVRSEYSPG
jgi:tetratricopeptide (TPR) repeat protein